MGMAQKRALRTVGFAPVQNGPQRPRVLESLRSLETFVRRIRVVEHSEQPEFHCSSAGAVNRAWIPVCDFLESVL